MSYIARRIMDDLEWYVHYGLPIAIQERNDHNLITDMRREFYGYVNTDDFTAALRALDDIDHDADPIIALSWIYHEIKHVLTPITRTANEAWIEDVNIAVQEGTNARAQRSER
jgi:hypothetical protein